MYLYKCVILALVASSSVRARSASSSQNSLQEHHHGTARTDDTRSYLGDLRYVYKVYKECAAADIGTCLKLKLVAAMDRADRAYQEVTIMDGVSFVKEPNSIGEPPKSETEIDASLPRTLNEKDDALNSLIADKIASFFNSHTLQVKLPSSSDLQRSFAEEGRKKKKDKGGSLFLVPMILGGTLIPLALGALALLAGKALIISKLALVLASIIGLKKLLSGSSSSSHDSGHEVVVGGHGGYARAFDEKEAAQNLAYSAYAPKT